VAKSRSTYSASALVTNDPYALSSPTMLNALLAAHPSPAAGASSSSSSTRAAAPSRGFGPPPAPASTSSSSSSASSASSPYQDLNPYRL
jgi:hypothetical protein